jgi:serine/threonine protein kinase
VRSQASSQAEVERSVRVRLYGERAAVAVSPRRGARGDRQEAGLSGRLAGGRYRLLERVGAGGMATVYRARDERLARDVAVKIIAERLARDPLFVRRFRREAQLCGRLAHPNIVTVLDAGVAPRDFIVMELVEGLDAGTLLNREGRLTPGEAVHVLAQAGEALAYAHDNGVIHQDVSPHNILIRWPDATAKLADFGLASDSLDRTARQETGGTPGYNYGEEARACEALFCFIGAEPETAWLSMLATDGEGFLKTDAQLEPNELGPGWELLGRRPLPFECNVPAVFAAGDVRAGSTKRVAAAVGEGASAVRSVHAAIGAARP